LHPFIFLGILSCFPILFFIVSIFPSNRHLPPVLNFSYLHTFSHYPHGMSWIQILHFVSLLRPISSKNKFYYTIFIPKTTKTIKENIKKKSGSPYAILPKTAAKIKKAVDFVFNVQRSMSLFIIDLNRFKCHELKSSPSRNPPRFRLPGRFPWH
jgi:hypothetical protein